MMISKLCFNGAPMKNKALVAVVVSLICFNVGCTKSSENSNVTSAPAVAQKAPLANGDSVRSTCASILKLYETKGVRYDKTEPYKSMFETGNLPITGTGAIPKVVDGRDRNQGVFMCTVEAPDEKGSTNSVALHIELDVDHNKVSEVKPLIKKLFYFEVLEPTAQSKLDSFFEEKMKGIKADSYFDAPAEVTVGRSHMRIMTVQKDAAMNFHLIVDLSIDY